MHLNELKKSNKIIGEFISGSHAYGLNTPTSDVDIRGIYINTVRERIALTFAKGYEQISDERNDITYYELARFMELARDCNPNVVESLFIPGELWSIKTPTMEKLIANRDLFISKKAFYSFSGYAHSQIKRAKGQQKWVNNPQPKEAPSKFDFCWIIPKDESKPQHLNDAIDYCRLEHYHVAGLEHVPNIYRLYHYGDKAKGVFRGSSHQLVPESIPIEDETTHFAGFLIFNETEYNRAMSDHKNYWEWIKNRNPNRYIAQEQGIIDYDAKSMMHCFRLLFSGENILSYSEPIVRFEGLNKEFLMDVRNGKFTHEFLMSYAESKMAKLEELYKTSSVRHHVDESKINDLYFELIGA